MTRLDEQMMRLIAVGASIAANCQPCMKTNAAKARECGADEQEIMQAIWVGKKVRQCAASKMDEFVASLSQVTPATSDLSNVGCECK